jgi:hypothetical protein
LLICFITLFRHINSCAEPPQLGKPQWLQPLNTLFVNDNFSKCGDAARSSRGRRK